MKATVIGLMMGSVRPDPPLRPLVAVEDADGNAVLIDGCFSIAAVVYMAARLRALVQAQQAEPSARQLAYLALWSIAHGWRGPLFTDPQTGALRPFDIDALLGMRRDTPVLVKALDAALGVYLAAGKVASDGAR